MSDAERVEMCRRRLERAALSSGAWLSWDGRVHEDIAAHILGLAPGTLANNRYAGTAPPHYRGGSITYSLADLAEWIERQRISG